MIQRTFFRQYRFGKYELTGAVGTDAADKVGGKVFVKGDPTPDGWTFIEYRQWHEDGKCKVFALCPNGDYIQLIGDAVYYTNPLYNFYEERLENYEIVRIKVDGLVTWNPAYEPTE